MNKFAKTVALSSGFLLVSLYAMARQAPVPVYAVAIDDCQVVTQITLGEEEYEAWQKIQDLEKQMQVIQGPLKTVEAKFSEYGKEMEELNELAVQETEQTLYIDKELLRKTERLADKISALADAHQSDFDAIGELGEKIGEQADIFSDTIESAFEGLDYNQVKIYKADEPLDLEQCYNEQLM
ncbi:hypothetical protein [Planctobacterium marinum]|uniref:Outer membrane protein H n=1 Tax=Planctobacterium marinum TaxID=1631968 RepID=A0AA48I0C9_9ALTE|nr:hypothetical protein MACH26_34510 [Planctobacterium marinum]